MFLLGCFKDVWSPCGNHHNTMQHMQENKHLNIGISLSSIVFLKMRWICLLFECLVLLGIGVQPLYLFVKTGE